MALLVFDRSTLKPVGEEYSESESRVIKEYFTQSKDVEEYKANFANDVFDYLKREDLHLACDCSPGIETMGMLDPEYDRRKERTHPAMYENWRSLIQHNKTANDPLMNAKHDSDFHQQLVDLIENGIQPRYASLRNVL